MPGDARNGLRFLMKNKYKRDTYFSLETLWHHSKQNKNYRMNKTLFGRLPFLEKNQRSMSAM